MSPSLCRGSGRAGWRGGLEFNSFILEVKEAHKDKNYLPMVTRLGSDENRASVAQIGLLTKQDVWTVSGEV